MKGPDLLGRGLLFHSLGATTAKAQPTLSLGLDCGAARSPKSHHNKVFGMGFNKGGQVSKTVGNNTIKIH